MILQGRNTDRSITLISILLPLLAWPLFAQNQESFSHLSVNDGLSQSTIFAITQDSKGFLWFGTREGGLNKFDGYDFHVYKNIPELPGSLSDNAIRSILEDSNEVLWIGTRDRGINRFEPASGQFKNYPLDMLSEVPQDKSIGVGSIYEDRSGRIWLGTKFRVYLYNKEADSFEPGLTKAPFPVKGITGICEDKQGYLYFSTWDRLIRYHPEKESYEQLLYEADPFAVFGGRINPLLIDQQDRLWAGTPEGLKTLHTEGEFRFDQNEYPTINWPASFSYVRTIKESRDGFIWFGTKDGLYSLSPDKTDLRAYKTDLRNPSSLIHNSIYSIFEDRVGTLWIGTWSGISMLDHRKYEFKHYLHSHNDLASLSSNIVSSFREGESGTWIGTEQGGLNFMDEDRTEFIAYQHREGDPSSLLSNNVKSIFRDSNEDLWIGTFNGGLSLYRENGTFTQFLEGYSIYTLEEMPGKKLYIGTKSGLFVLDLNTREVTSKVFPSTTGISSLEAFIMSLFVDSKNRLWIGTRRNGVYLFDDSRASVKQFLSSKLDSTTLSGNYVISMCEDQNRNIWIGTSSGLNLFEEASQTFVRNHGKVGLENYVIDGLMPDDMGRLWISTNSGIFTYNPLEGQLFHYEYLDGLQSNEFNRGAYYKNSSGEMFFGGVNGFNVFHPEDIRMNPDPPPVILTDLKLFNKSVVPDSKNSPLIKHISDTEQIILSHRQSSFSLDFVALNYLIPEKNKYAFMLEGYDENFIQSGRTRSASYMNLKPGSYTFRVIASNNDGVWNEQGTSLDILIKGPIWATPLAIVLYVITLVALLVLLIRIVSYRTEKESELSFERAEKAKLLELNRMRLQFFTNISHEFRTPLTLISGPLNKLMSGNYEHQREYLHGMMKSNVNRMLRLVNQLMDFRKLENEKMPLHIKKGNLNDFLSQIVSGFDDMASSKMIELKYNSYFEAAEGEEQWFDEGIVDKVTYNLLSNAFKFTPEQGIIKVSLYLSEKTARLEVRDTGKGIAMEKVSRIFDRFYSENSEVFEGTGIGLSLSKKLIDLHKGEIKVESEKGKGATFTVILPIRKEDFEKNEIFSTLDLNEYVRPELDADNITQLIGSSGNGSAKSGKTMLIAEDEKELASYLVEHFPNYDTLVAENGRIAYQKARELIPDIIISDIKMPEMNGLEFLEKTREDFLTSHIPFVLLTARTAKEHKLEGLETGADAYLEKPFDGEYLTVLVNNLLKQRKKLRQKFSGQLEQASDAEGLRGADKEFLEKVNGIVMEHISNPEFSVENVMAEVGMSRSQLYRKFKAISNRNPSEYIRLLRLGHAAELLRENKYSINEVAFMSGFGNVSYFNTCFKRHFGTSPGKYLS